MTHAQTRDENESTRLIEAQGGQSSSDSHAQASPSQMATARRILPVALFAALAMASTAATAYFAYATLLCKDPLHCDGEESSRYAGSVAVVTFFTNILGMSALGPLQKLATVNRKLGLQLWMLCRSMSAVMLLLGVSVDSIYIALSGRIFEGLASDNLLHFSLNAVYAQSQNTEEVGSLINYSLALYMIGISVSPFVSGLFKHFATSFAIALGLFAFAIAYLHVFVANPRPAKGGEEDRGLRANLSSRAITLHAIVAPLKILQDRALYGLIGLSLFAYNVVQSYMFNALLIHTSVRFGFTGRENGFLISSAHSVAALHVLTSTFILPKLTRRSQRARPMTVQSTARNAVLALISLGVQSISLVLVGFADRVWHVYLATILLALGLPAPSFIKAYFVCIFEGEQKAAGLAALAVTETLGSVVGPLLLGGLQSYFGAGGDVFFVCGGLVLVSLMALAFSLIQARSVGGVHLAVEP